MPQLPNELVYSIIEELYDSDDPRTCWALQSCALVARAWVHASQRGIFRSIDLNLSLEGIEQHLARLISVFDANPRLANYVRHLDITIYANRCVESVDAVTNLVNHISELDEIWFSGFSWDAIPSALEENFLRFLRLPSLSKVAFWHIHFDHFVDFASLLSNLTHLKSLEISNMRFRDWNMSGGGKNYTTTTHSLPLPRSIQLVDLELRDTAHGPFLAWFQQDSCPFDFGKLRALHLQDDRSKLYHERAAWIIQCAGESLRELEIEGLRLNRQSMGAVHIGYTCNLHHLTLLDVQQTASLTPVLLIESFLKPVINSNQYHPLQSLTIYLSVEQHGPEDNPLQTHDWDQWTAIDKMCEHKAFAALEEVSICFGDTSFIRNANKEKKEKIEQLLHKVLPFLVESGKLCYKFERRR